jgi:E3 ubiquitin-protein ligase HECTD1
MIVVSSLFQDDDDGHMSALNIIQDLLEKANEVFIEHFARLGVISKVSEMVGPLLEEEDEEGNGDEIDGAVGGQGEVC